MSICQTCNDTHYVQCGRCGGTGKFTRPGWETDRCIACLGGGVVGCHECRERENRMMASYYEQDHAGNSCVCCNGSGHILNSLNREYPCFNCGGSGKTK